MRFVDNKNNIEHHQTCSEGTLGDFMFFDWIILIHLNHLGEKRAIKIIFEKPGPLTTSFSLIPVRNTRLTTLQ